MSLHERAHARAAIVRGVGELMPEDAAQAVRERPDRDGRDPDRIEWTIGRAKSEDDRDQRRKEICAAGVAEDAEDAARFETERRERVERERQPCGEIAAEEDRVIAPEPGEDESRGDRERDQDRD